MKTLMMLMLAMSFSTACAFATEDTAKPNCTKLIQDADKAIKASQAAAVEPAPANSDSAPASGTVK